MEFSINNIILSSTPIFVNSLELNLPKNWEGISSEQFDLMENIFKQDSLMNEFNLINGHSNGKSLILFITKTTYTRKFYKKIRGFFS